MPTLTVALGAAYAALHGEARPGAGGGGIRGIIGGFSGASRKRMIDLVHQVDRNAVNPPLFVTLTYPGEYPTDWRVYKRHLDSWLKRLLRRWPGAGVLWRLEYQRRGAPHYHVLVFHVSFIPADWLAESWYQVVGSGDSRHLAAGTQVARVHTWRGASYYCAKYLAKTCEGADLPTGRMWGIRGEVPIDLLEVPLTWEQFHRMRRVFRGWYERQTGRRAWWTSQRGSGITAYLPDGEVARVLAWAVQG